MHRHPGRRISFLGRGARAALARLAAILLVGATVTAGECDPKGPDFFSPVDGEFLPGLGDIFGRVTVDGEGRSGVTVTARRGNDVVGTVTTGGDGQYEFINLEPGTYTVSISTIPNAQCPGPQTAVVPPNDEVRVDFPCTSVPTTGTVTGTVVDQDGNGIGGAQVVLDGRTTTTGSDGSFAFEDVDPGSYSVQATADNFDCPGTSTSVTAGQTSEVQVQCSQIHPTGSQIAENPYRLDGSIRGEDECEIGSTISNPGPITIRAEVEDGQTFIVIESDAEVVGIYVLGQEWTGTGEVTFTSNGTNFTLRETVNGLWQFSGGTIELIGTLTFEVFVTDGGTKVCESAYDATYEQLQASSARFKSGIRALLPGSLSPLGLRPVVFRYRPPWGDPAVPRVGLIAEEVDRIFPEAVARDGAGRPIGIYYGTLGRLVVEEVQARAGRAAAAAVSRLADALEIGGRG